MITFIFTHFLLVFLVHSFSHEFLSLQASEFGPYSTDFTTSCWETERNALLKFKEGLEDPSSRLSSWVGNNCCAWSGVGCSKRTKHVIKLDLRNPFSGNRSDTQLSALDLASLRGKLNPSLLDLKYLEYLDLSWNNFEQTPIPHFIGSFTKLNYLDLSYASFAGLVPPHLGNLSNLQSLDLSTHNTFPVYQNIWVSNLNWISRLSFLKFLNLGGADLSSASTNYWLQAVNMLPSLFELHLPRCNLLEIPNSLPIVNFSSIRVIDLSENDFNSPLPVFLFNISTLVKLDLSANGFQGHIPPSLGNLESIKHLDLNENYLSGPLPIFIGNLSSLESLYLSDNQLSGTIPETIGQLKELTHLDLSSNNWEGVVSRIHFLHLRKLKRLQLSSGFRDNSSLVVFNVGQEWVPPFSLISIYLAKLQIDPKFPSWLQTQKELTTIILLQLEISDLVPEWFWKLSPQIELLVLINTKLHGRLPRSLKFAPGSDVDLSFNLFQGPLPLFSGVESISLRHNLLSGFIPADCGLDMLDLQFMDLAENHLQGSIPSLISKMESLGFLSLEKNKLYGEIPSWKRLKNLDVLDLSNNNLSGSIPSSLCSQSQLSLLKLNDNNLSGKLSFLRNCTSLVELSLANNQFFGGIPSWIGENLPSLSILQLRGNMFRGRIPKKLCRLSKLHVIDLGRNNFSGLIPTCLGNLNGMHRSVEHSYERERFNDEWDMEFTLKGQTLKFTEIIPLVNLIDLSSNNLEGEIPKEIVKLFALGTLNLSRNQLTGNIPEKIGDLQLLETLDLSVNHLLGPIPASMSSMTFLSHLNLSYNDLSGPIPSANQFQTFNDPSIYEGNPKLCGAPLPTNCSTHKNDTPEGYTGKDRDESWSERLWFYTGIASGFVVGFWAVYGTLVIKRSWRHAYFRFVEEMKDRIYVFIVVKTASLQKKLKGERSSDNG
ncbi:hypothetical protein SLE2022_047900 [Rubroshorea leprosula]